MKRTIKEKIDLPIGNILFDFKMSLATRQRFFESSNFGEFSKKLNKEELELWIKLKDLIIRNNEKMMEDLQRRLQ